METWRWIGAVVGCVALAVALRLPWLEAPLSVDEGGVALVAQGWLQGGDSLYGHYWLDRPPLLLALYKLALSVGPGGIRALGALAAGAVVVLVALIARSVAGRRAAVIAALLAGLAASSAAIQAVFTPAELLAVVPSAASVLALVVAWRREESLAAIALAGGCAVCAVLIKQSFLDALLAGGAFLAVAALRPAESGFRARWALAYLAGAAVPYAATEIWERLASVGEGAVSTALLGFRIEALFALQGSGRPLLDRVTELALPALGSGVALMLLWTGLGLLGLRHDRVLAATLAAWLAGGCAGVMAGGTYWPHYLIQLVPVTAVLGAVALARTPRRPLVATLGLLLMLAIGGTSVSLALDPERRFQATERSVGAYVRDHAARGDTVQVLYARANVVYFSGLRSPYPYQWSLMLRAVPGARQRLERLLASSKRPTWLVRWQPDNAWGLDPGGAVRTLVGRDYRRVATVCGRPIYLRRDVTRALAADRSPASCTRPTGLGL